MAQLSHKQERGFQLGFLAAEAIGSDKMHSCCVGNPQLVVLAGIDLTATNGLPAAAVLDASMIRQPGREAALR